MVPKTPAPVWPSDRERSEYAQRLKNAEIRVLAGRPSILRKVPKWAAVEVAQCVPYLHEYAKSGIALDPASGGFSADLIIMPDALAREALQLAVAHRPLLSKRLGAGNKHLQKCNEFYRRAADLTGQYNGAITVLGGLRSALPEATWTEGTRAARFALKAASQTMAADVANFMSEILATGGGRKSQYEGAIQKVKKLMAEGATSKAARQATIASSSAKTTKEAERLGRALLRAIPVSDN
jgi:hypothetical protein